MANTPSETETEDDEEDEGDGELAVARRKNKEMCAIAKKEKRKLQEFWSTNTPERTAKFKQIVLQREIGLHDFQAIFTNSTFVEKEAMYAAIGAKTDTQIDLTRIYIPWHLSAVPTTNLSLHPEYSGTISTRTLDYSAAGHPAIKMETHIDDGLLFVLSEFLDLDFPFAKFHRKPLNDLRIKLVTDKNPSPIEKIDINTITPDNIDNIDGLLEKVNIYDLIPEGKTLSYLFTNFNIPQMWPDIAWYDDDDRLKTTKRKDSWAVVLAWLLEGDFTFETLRYNVPNSIDTDIMAPNNNFEAVYDVETEEFRWDDVATNPKYDHVENGSDW